MSPAEAAIREALKVHDELGDGLRLLAACNPAILRSLLSELDSLRARCEEGDTLLRNLNALVWGECRSLLDEDSGGDSHLAIAIDAHLKGAGRE